MFSTPQWSRFNGAASFRDTGRLDAVKTRAMTDDSASAIRTRMQTRKELTGA
jgi:hypothetical protein